MMISQEQIIVAQARTRDVITVNCEKEYSGFITIALRSDNRFWIYVEFEAKHLTMKEVHYLYIAEQSHRIFLSSEIIRRENYNIKEVEVAGYYDGDYVVWECFSVI